MLGTHEEDDLAAKPSTAPLALHNPLERASICTCGDQQGPGQAAA